MPAARRGPERASIQAKTRASPQAGEVPPGTAHTVRGAAQPAPPARLWDSLMIPTQPRAAGHLPRSLGRALFSTVGTMSPA